MTDYRKVIISKDVCFDESSTVLENLDEASTSRTNFELPALKSEYFGESVLDSVKEATADKVNIPAPDSAQESDSFRDEEEHNREWKDPLNTFVYYPGLRVSIEYTAGVPFERFNYDTGLVSSVMRGKGHITAPSS